MTNIEKLYQSIESEKQRSAWDKGVTKYALELVEQLGEQINGGYFEELDLTEPKKVRAALLNGAADWSQYSWGGCSLIYNSDIAERLCNPSELKKTRNGERRPNSREEWLDTQARALFQAANRVCRHIRTLKNPGLFPILCHFERSDTEMRKYKLKELRELVRLGVAEDYTNKPSEYIYTLCRLEKVGYSSGVYGINGGLVQDTETGTLYAIIGRCTNLFILF